MFQRAGHSEVRTRTGSNGEYKLVLAPGAYSVALAWPRRMGPTSARVTSGRFRTVDFSIDTGIR